MKGRTGKQYAMGGTVAAPRAPSAAAIAPGPSGASDLPVTGKISAMRLDRPGRRLGGACGAEFSPLSSASKAMD